MEIVTLVISIVGLVLGAISLFWNVQRWLLDAPRLEVRSARGMMTGNSAEVVTITVKNIGRGDTQITTFPGFATLNEVSFGGALLRFRRQVTGPPKGIILWPRSESPDLPCTLKAGHALTFYYDAFPELVELIEDPKKVAVVSSVNGEAIEKR